MLPGEQCPALYLATSGFPALGSAPGLVRTR
jgi:hypothetical protein